MAFSGERKDSSFRHETTEGSDGPGCMLRRRETPQQEIVDQRQSEPSRTLTVGHLRWLRELAYTPPWHQDLVVILGHNCKTNLGTMSLYPRNNPNPMGLSGMRSYIWSSCVW